MKNSNLSEAISHARKLKEIEIAERLERRRKRDLQVAAQLNEQALFPSRFEKATPLLNSLQVDTHGDIQLTLPTSVNVHEKAQPNQTEKLPDQGSSDDLSQVDELEIPPDTKFTKVHNAVFDQLIPYLSGNQFAVYMELYRNTLGRGHSGNWFRTREVQKICGIGSDKTVRLAIVALEQMKLIRVDWPQKKGNPRGLFIRVLSLEKALSKLEKKPGNQTESGYLSTSVPQ